MKISIFFAKIRLKFFPRFAKKDDYNKVLISSGIKVGKGTIFYDPSSMTIDRERPWMLEIGEYCKITKGVTILTHDYSRSVLRRVFKEIVPEAGKTVIGNNVFIGVNSTILMGSKIGNNVIVGANSVVSGNIPDNVVVAGNPCSTLCTLEEFYKKRKGRVLSNAFVYYSSFVEKYHRRPQIREMGPFFVLFASHDEDYLKRYGIDLHFNGDEFTEILNDFIKEKPLFSSFEQFIEYMENYKNE